MAIKVRMLEDGFIEGRRRRKGQVLVVHQPRLVSFKAMELFDEKDIDLVKKAHADVKAAKKTQARHSAVVEPQLVKPDEEELSGGLVVDPDSGMVLGPSLELDEQGKAIEAMPGRPQTAAQIQESVI